MSTESIEAQEPADDAELSEVDTDEEEVEYALAPDEDDILSDEQDTGDEEED